MIPINTQSWFNYKDIESEGTPPFRNSDHINEGSSDVKGTSNRPKHELENGQVNLISVGIKEKQLHEVDVAHWYYTEESEDDVEGASEFAVSGGGEVGPEGDYEHCGTADRHKGDV